MRPDHSSGRFATPLAVALLIYVSPNVNADQPPDLSEYRTVATAQTATPAALVGAAERRPGYLGVNAEPDAGGLRVAAVEPDSPAALADIRRRRSLEVGGRHRRSPTWRPCGTCCSTAAKATG